MNNVLCVAVAVFALANAGSTVFAAATNAPAVAAGPFVVQPPFVAPAVPESVFVAPKNQSEGRDPFFPKSDRPYLQYNPQPTKVVVTPKPQADLALKGMSGTPEQPLAIINNATFSVGEEGDVMTKAGKMSIRCEEIRPEDGAVVVAVGGERRVLRLAVK